jgi:hypothetical protein
LVIAIGGRIPSRAVSIKGTCPASKIVVGNFLKLFVTFDKGKVSENGSLSKTTSV